MRRLRPSRWRCVRLREEVGPGPQPERQLVLSGCVRSGTVRSVTLPQQRRMRPEISRWELSDENS